MPDAKEEMEKSMPEAKTSSAGSYGQAMEAIEISQIHVSSRGVTHTESSDRHLEAFKGAILMNAPEKEDLFLWCDRKPSEDVENFAYGQVKRLGKSGLKVVLREEETEEFLEMFKGMGWLLSPTIEKVGFAFNLENHESKMSLEELNMHSCTVGLTEEETKTMISDLCTEGAEVTLADLIASYDDGNKLLQKLVLSLLAKGDEVVAEEKKKALEEAQAQTDARDGGREDEKVLDEKFIKDSEAKQDSEETWSPWAEENEAVMAEIQAQLEEMAEASRQESPSALIQACQHDHFQVVESLLQKNINPNSKDKKTGKTALAWACTSSSVEVVKVLIQFNANVNTRDNFGQTPLFDAAKEGSAEMIKTLHTSGAKINLTTPDGSSPLFYAVSLGNEDTVKALLKLGADPRIARRMGKEGKTGKVESHAEGKDEKVIPGEEKRIPLTGAVLSNLSPLQLAMMQGRPRIAELLKAAIEKQREAEMLSPPGMPPQLVRMTTTEVAQVNTYAPKFKSLFALEENNPLGGEDAEEKLSLAGISPHPIWRHPTYLGDFCDAYVKTSGGAGEASLALAGTHTQQKMMQGYLEKKRLRVYDDKSDPFKKAVWKHRERNGAQGTPESCLAVLSRIVDRVITSGDTNNAGLMEQKEKLKLVARNLKTSADIFRVMPEKVEELPGFVSKLRLGIDRLQIGDQILMLGKMSKDGYTVVYIIERLLDSEEKESMGIPQFLRDNGRRSRCLNAGISKYTNERDKKPEWIQKILKPDNKEKGKIGKKGKGGKKEKKGKDGKKKGNDGKGKGNNRKKGTLKVPKKPGKVDKNVAIKKKKVRSMKAMLQEARKRVLKVPELDELSEDDSEEEQKEAKGDAKEAKDDAKEAKDAKEVTFDEKQDKKTPRFIQDRKKLAEILKSEEKIEILNDAIRWKIPYLHTPVVSPETYNEPSEEDEKTPGGKHGDEKVRGDEKVQPEGEDQKIEREVKSVRSRRYRFTICNVGQSTEIHHFWSETEAPDINKCLSSISFGDVRHQDLSDAFLLVLFSTCIPSVRFDLDAVYEKLLPFIGRKCLKKAQTENLTNGISDWRPPQLSGSSYRNILEGFRFMLTRSGIPSQGADRMLVLIKVESLRFVEADLRVVHSLNSSDRLLIEIGCRELSYVASILCARGDNKGGLDVPDVSPYLLRKIQHLLASVEKLTRVVPDLSSVSERYPKLHLTKCGKGVAMRTESLFFDNHGALRFRAHESKQPLIADEFRPFDLTHPYLSKPANSLNSARLALSMTLQTLLKVSSQEKFLRGNSKAIQMGLLSHLIGHVLPVPSPHKKRFNDKTVWREPMTYAVQRDTLKMLSKLLKFLLALCFSSDRNEQIDALRTVGAAAIYCMYDCVIRQTPADFANPVARVLNDSSGFYVGSMDKLLAATSTLKICSGGLTRSLGQAIEYVKTSSFGKYRMFDGRFVQRGSGDERFVEQVALHAGIQVEGGSMINFLYGDVVGHPHADKTMLFVFTEIFQWRKFVLLTKYAIAPAPYPPKVEMQHHRCRFTLRGDAREIRASFIPLKEAKFTEYPKPVLYASHASPNVYMEGDAKSETDILHIRDLPKISVHLSTRDTENMLSFLTVPYLRVPLLLGFLANEERVLALSDPNVQKILEAALFEPGPHLSKSKFLEIPAHVPSKPSTLGTPLGFLLNELQMNPSHATRSILLMLKCALDLGQKDYDKTLAPALLFALNLATRVVGFVSALLDKIPDKSKKMPEYFGDPNDLMAVSQSSVEVLQQFRKAFYKTLRRRVSPVLEHWIKISIKMGSAATSEGEDKKEGFGLGVPPLMKIYAHMAFVWSGLREDEMDRTIVSQSLRGALFVSMQPTPINRASDQMGISFLDWMPAVHGHRSEILQWLRAQPPRLSAEVLDEVVLACTGTEANTGSEQENTGGFLWIERSELMGDHGGGGLFIHTDPLEVLLTKEAKNKRSEAAKRCDSLISRRTSGGKTEGAVLILKDEKEIECVVEGSGSDLVCIFLLDSSDLTRGGNIVGWLKAIAKADEKTGHQVYVADLANSKKPGDYIFFAKFAESIDLETIPAVAFFKSTHCVGTTTHVNPEHIRTLISFYAGRGARLRKIRTRGRGRVKLNLNSMQLTLETKFMRPLDQKLAEMEDCIEIFGEKPVRVAEKSRRLDVQVYEVIGRRYQITHWERPGDFISTLVGREYNLRSLSEFSPSQRGRAYPEWLHKMQRFITQEVFRGVYDKKHRYQGLESIEVSIYHDPKAIHSSKIILIADCNCNLFGRRIKIYKRIELFRYTLVCNVYNILLHNRQLYHSQIYTSNSRLCMALLDPPKDDRPSEWHPLGRFAAGHPLAVFPGGPQKTVQISRELAAGVSETFLPSRLLRGILPEALLESHQFWRIDTARGRAAGTEIVGKMRAITGLDDPKQKTTRKPYKLLIRLGSSSSTVIRIPEERKEEKDRQEDLKADQLLDAVFDDDETKLGALAPSAVRQASRDSIQDSKLRLVDLTGAHDKTSSLQVARILTRIENLSHILAWARCDNVTGNVDCKADNQELALIELPRKNLSFAPRVEQDSSGKTVVRIYSLDFEGLFIAPDAEKDLGDLLKGIPHSLVLQSRDLEFSILVPSVRFRRPNIASCPLSTQIVLNHGDTVWNTNLKSPCYMYPVHISRSFLSTRSLASAIYLLALRLSARDYKTAFAMAPSISTDLPPSPEESQVFELIGELLREDAHPNAMSCRLKILLEIDESPMRPKDWSVAGDWEGYLRRRPHVSVGCRLTPKEELQIIDIVWFESRDTIRWHTFLCGNKLPTLPLRGGSDAGIWQYKTLKWGYDAIMRRGESKSTVVDYPYEFTHCSGIKVLTPLAVLVIAESFAYTKEARKMAITWVDVLRMLHGETTVLAANEKGVDDSFNFARLLLALRGPDFYDQLMQDERKNQNLLEKFPTRKSWWSSKKTVDGDGAFSVEETFMGLLWVMYQNSDTLLECCPYYPMPEMKMKWWNFGGKDDFSSRMFLTPYEDNDVLKGIQRWVPLDAKWNGPGPRFQQNNDVPMGKWLVNAHDPVKKSAIIKMHYDEKINRYSLVFTICAEEVRENYEGKEKFETLKITIKTRKKEQKKAPATLQGYIFHLSNDKSNMNKKVAWLGFQNVSRKTGLGVNSLYRSNYRMEIDNAGRRKNFRGIESKKIYKNGFFRPEKPSTYWISCTPETVELGVGRCVGQRVLLGYRCENLLQQNIPVSVEFQAKNKMHKQLAVVCESVNKARKGMFQREDIDKIIEEDKTLSAEVKKILTDPKRQQKAVEVEKKKKANRIKWKMEQLKLVKNRTQERKVRARARAADREARRKIMEPLTKEKKVRDARMTFLTGEINRLESKKNQRDSDAKNRCTKRAEIKKRAKEREKARRVMDKDSKSRRLRYDKNVRKLKKQMARAERYTRLYDLLGEEIDNLREQEKGAQAMEKKALKGWTAVEKTDKQSLKNFEKRERSDLKVEGKELPVLRGHLEERNRLTKEERVYVKKITPLNAAERRDNTAEANDEKEKRDDEQFRQFHLRPEAIDEEDITLDYCVWCDNVQEAVLIAREIKATALSFRNYFKGKFPASDYKTHRFDEWKNEFTPTQCAGFVNFYKRDHERIAMIKILNCGLNAKKKIFYDISLVPWRARELWTRMRNPAMFNVTESIGFMEKYHNLLTTPPITPKFESVEKTKISANKAEKKARTKSDAKESTERTYDTESLTYSSPLLKTPRLVDFSCERRQMAIGFDTGRAAVDLSVNEMQSFSTSTLSLVMGGIDKFIVPDDAFQRGYSNMPIDLSGFDLVKGNYIAEDMLKRISEDITSYHKWCDDRLQSGKGTLTIRFCRTKELARYVDSIAIGDNPVGLTHAIDLLKELQSVLVKMHSKDLEILPKALETAVSLANSVTAEGQHDELERFAFAFRRLAGREITFTMPHLLGLLAASDAEARLRANTKSSELGNPYLSDLQAERVMNAVLSYMLHTHRMGAASQAISAVVALRKKLEDLHTNPKSRTNLQKNRESVRARVLEGLRQTAQACAKRVAVRRQYVRDIQPGSMWEYDPRLLLFEFSFNLTLRDRQVRLFREFMAAFKNKKSRVEQMIMGAGKTTVIGPLLVLGLSDGKRLVVQVVPAALLEMSRAVLRQKFSLIVKKKVINLSFERDSKLNYQKLLTKLKAAVREKSVVISTPTSVKSVMIKFLEHVYDINNEIMSVEGKETLTKEAGTLARILNVFKSGSLIMDEVDMLLHPLKSELNFPIGGKFDLDFTPLRYEIAQYVMDAILFAQNLPSSQTYDDDRERKAILENLRMEVNKGINEKAFQRVPHLTLLDQNFYKAKIKPLMTKWIALFLQEKGLNGEEVILFNVCAGLEPGQSLDEKLASRMRKLDAEKIRMINNASDWLLHYLPHTLVKINRVSFGLLNDEWIAEASGNDVYLSRSRLLLAVPYLGKDMPSRSSEFSHPDIQIGLTVLAYAYSGLRWSDFSRLITELRLALLRESGPMKKRPSSLLYNDWVKKAGGIVRGVHDRGEIGMGDKIGFMTDAAFPPLQTLNPTDEEIVSSLHRLLLLQPNVSHHYLRVFVFPEVLQARLLKIKASGQELGGEMLFEHRIGFSGTPSQLVPFDLEPCGYEKLADAEMVNFLTDENIVSFSHIVDHWTVDSLLAKIARENNPPFHALIDSGALITGYSNLEVAEKLLKEGLENMDGVVFLDDHDRKMMLVRNGWNVVELSQCGIALERRFAFYDQIHTTGMDIKHCLNAVAAQTLGKDNIFRDFAQGAYRMRGIGNGQKIHLLIIPEVNKLIHASSASPNSAENPQPDRKSSESKARAISEVKDKKVSSIITSFQPRSILSTEDDKEMLLKMFKWLMLQSIERETVMSISLSLQNLENVWRKKGLDILLDYWTNSKKQKDDKILRMKTAGDLFCDPVETMVSTEPRTQKPLLEYLKDLANERLSFLDEEFAERVERIANKESSSLIELWIRSPPSDSVENRPRKDPADVKSIQTAWKSITAILKREEGGGRGGLKQADKLDALQVEEQEQEQRPGDEMEEDFVADARGEETFQDIKYDRSNDKIVRWTLDEMCGEFKKIFKPFSSFVVADAYKKVSLKFPEDILFSQNYYREIKDSKSRWGVSSEKYREQRLKNITVFMEFAPSSKDVAVSMPPDEKVNIPEEIQNHLKSTFHLLDSDGNQILSQAEIQNYLRAVGMPYGPADAKRMILRMGGGEKGVACDQFIRAVATRSAEDAETGRYIVVLSLAEAESMHRIIHAFSAQGKTIGHKFGKTSELTLRLDASMGEKPSMLSQSIGSQIMRDHQLNRSRQCLRFIDCEHFYERASLNLLLLVLGLNTSKSREAFFTSVLKRKRRVQSGWQDQPVFGLFRRSSSISQLHLQALVSRIASALQARGMGLRDAYRTFDRLKNGQLSRSELYAAARFLGIRVTPEDISELVAHIDIDKDGSVSYPELQQAFEGYDFATDTSAVEQDAKLPSGERVSPLLLSEKEEILIDSELKKAQKALATVYRSSNPDMAEIFAQLVFSEIPSAPTPLWTSAKFDGSGGECKVWSFRPPQDRPGEMFLSLGHTVTLESLEKTQVCAPYIKVSSTLMHRNGVRKVVDKMLPPPSRYKLAFFIDSTKFGFRKKIWIWEPIPHDTSKAMAVGMIATLNKNPPPLSAVRCINKILLVKIKSKVIMNKYNIMVWDCKRPEGSFWHLQERKGLLWCSPHSGRLSETRKRKPKHYTFKSQAWKTEVGIESDGNIKNMSYGDRHITFAPKPGLDEKPGFFNSWFRGSNTGMTATEVESDCSIM